MGGNKTSDVLDQLIINDQEQAFVVVPFLTMKVCAVFLLWPFQLLKLWENFKKFYVNTIQLETTLTYVTSVMGIFCRMCYNTTAMRNFSVAFGVMKMTNKLMFLSPTNALLYYTYKRLKYTVKISHDCSYMFWSIWTIIREPMPNLAKVTILCRYSVKIRRLIFNLI